MAKGYYYFAASKLKFYLYFSYAFIPTLKIEFSKALAIDVAVVVNVLYSNMYIEL